MAESVDYSVSSDEEEHQCLSVAPVVGWQTAIPTSQPQEVGREVQPPADGATATQGQHEATVSQQVKEPEDEPSKQPLTAPAPSVDSTRTHSSALACIPKQV